MTQPYTEYSKLAISDKYHQALNILKKYRVDLINTNTLKGQNPKGTLENSETIVRKKGQQLIKGIEYPNSTQMDSDVKKVVEDLLPILQDPDPDVKTFVLDWARKMFDMFIFTIEAEHIENLLKTPFSLDVSEQDKESEQTTREGQMS